LLWDEEDSAVASDTDDLQGDTDPQWPSAQLMKLKPYLKHMDGLRVDAEA
jgi:hypothetical protein